MTLHEWKPTASLAALVVLPAWLLLLPVALVAGGLLFVGAVAWAWAEDAIEGLAELQEWLEWGWGR